MPNRRSALMRAATIALLGLSLLTPLAAAAATIMAATPIARTDLPWWRSRHEAKLRELAQTRPDLIFLGDSITQNWERAGPPEWQNFAPEWTRFYGDRNAINLGFKIPAGDPAYQVEANTEFQRDVLLLSMFPHMHLRGKDFEFKAVYPTGEPQVPHAPAHKGGTKPVELLQAQ